ncbi:MAG: prepilin-type N-terminal cleavage/methylation domain-containing protein [Marinobacterium sp.]|nr:prepilin-type N-terminal cleavage/methylation domain-containing protein [Marinobacterium sp.]
MRTQQKQGGFTLVEIAIVMVIIGLLLGGALKGQEMINNARTKRVKADFDQIVAAFYSYQDIYRALPGDNTNATAQHGGTISTSGTQGNRFIEGIWNNNSTAANSSETRVFWQNLRSANLLAGSDDALPQNSFGGVIGVGGWVEGMNGPVLCFNNIDADVAQVIDNQYDDGDGTDGSMRGFSNQNLSAGAQNNYTPAFVGIICMEM